jgi:hypothetical protein
MKTLFIGLLLTSLAFAADYASPSPAGIGDDGANPVRGQKLYAKYFYTKCGMTCGEMAKKFTQAEWESFFRKGLVEEKINDYCSIMDDLSTKQISLIYDYMYYHAKDSGRLAPCDF